LALQIGEQPDSSSLISTRIGSVRRVVCGSPSYFARRGVPENVDELAMHDCITFEGFPFPDFWVFPTSKSYFSAAVHSRLVVNTAEAAIDAAIAGLGVTRVLSRQVTAAVKAGRLNIVLEEVEPLPSPVSLVYSGQRRLPLKLRAFLDFAAPRLKARLLKAAM